MEIFGQYQLIELVGRGGMGEVFRARDTRHERTVALKRLRATRDVDPVRHDAYRERFRRECRLAARLSSPHVVPIHDFGEIDGRLYLDMRLVEGPHLGALVRREGHLAPARAVELVRQVAEALDDAHGHGLVHRDVKPSNVLLAPARERGPDRDVAYLADFGIARDPGELGGDLTGLGVAPGTPLFMAPECYGVDAAGFMGPALDVYALGCLLVELLTGGPPYQGGGPSVMYGHLAAAPPTPSTLVDGVPTGLDEVVAQALAKTPGDRYATAGDLAEAAERALAPRRQLVAVGAGGPEGAVGPVPWGGTGTGADPGGDVGGSAGLGARAASDEPGRWPGARGWGGGSPWGGGSGSGGSGGGTPGPGGGASPFGNPGTGPGTSPYGTPTGPGYGSPPRGGAPGGPAYGTQPYGSPPYGSPPYGSPTYGGPSGGRPPRRRKGAIIGIIAALTAMVVVGVVTLVVVTRGSSSPAPSAAPVPPAVTTTTTPPVTATPALASDVTSVFPDITTLGPACSIYRPQTGEFVTTSGQRAQTIYYCRYDNLAPNAGVYYIQWPSAAAAREWYDDTRHHGAAIDSRDEWTIGGQHQGPIHTWQGQQSVISTAGYDNHAYTFDIYTTTQAQGDTVFAGITLRRGTEIAN